jgi:mutator protein MutT
MTSPGQRIGIAVVLSHDATGCLVGIRPCEAPLGGMLEFPGGKCLQHESPREAALRECLEETGIAVEPLRQLEQRTVDYDHGRVELHFWLCQPRQAEPPPPASPFAWSPLDELEAARFPQANALVIERLVDATGIREQLLRAADQTESTHDA